MAGSHDPEDDRELVVIAGAARDCGPAAAISAVAEPSAGHHQGVEGLEVQRVGDVDDDPAEQLRQLGAIAETLLERLDPEGRLTDLYARRNGRSDRQNPPELRAPGVTVSR